MTQRDSVYIDGFGYLANRYISSENEVGVFYYANRSDFELCDKMLTQVETLYENGMLVNEISKFSKLTN